MAAERHFAHQLLGGPNSCLTVIDNTAGGGGGVACERRGKRVRSSLLPYNFPVVVLSEDSSGSVIRVISPSLWP